MSLLGFVKHVAGLVLAVGGGRFSAPQAPIALPHRLNRFERIALRIKSARGQCRYRRVPTTSFGGGLLNGGRPLLVLEWQKKPTNSLFAARRWAGGA